MNGCRELTPPLVFPVRHWLMVIGRPTSGTAVCTTRERVSGINIANQYLYHHIRQQATSCQPQGQKSKRDARDLHQLFLDQLNKLCVISKGVELQGMTLHIYSILTRNCLFQKMSRTTKWLKYGLNTYKSFLNICFCKSLRTQFGFFVWIKPLHTVCKLNLQPKHWETGLNRTHWVNITLHSRNWVSSYICWNWTTAYFWLMARYRSFWMLPPHPIRQSSNYATHPLHSAICCPSHWCLYNLCLADSIALCAERHRQQAWSLLRLMLMRLTHCPSSTTIITGFVQMSKIYLKSKGNGCYICVMWENIQGLIRSSQTFFLKLHSAPLLL